MDIQKNNANERAEENTMVGSGSKMAPGSIAAIARGLRSGAWRALGVAIIAGGSLTMASCNSQVTEGRSPVYLIIESLAGANGAEDTETFFSNVDSDVITIVKDADNNDVVTYFEDPGSVTLRIAYKDITSPTGPTTNNFVTINRYRVEYRRSDGRSRPGVDVPYAFDGAATFTVTDESTTSGFVLVRIQAKREAPLTTLAGGGGGGGGISLSTLADVTFYGRDQTGNEVQVTGTISVNFANWGDPK
jgi:hypothetical protein